jgi:NAD(P)-dependent dehydrogenase (short-subunit alcohol dehydrogenase family)
VDSFADRLAVVTGGGSGMGQELVIQLAAAGCSVATCDVRGDSLAETQQRAEKDAPPGTKITTHTCDVSDEHQVNLFRDSVVEQHNADHIDLLFNNAGVGGGGSFVNGDRAEWDKTFGVDWFGVYYCSRAFVPLLVASDDAHLVNTSSVNGFWARLAPGVPHTAYSAAKFAVKGFSEALIEDFRTNAPHVKVSVVMPGHIGTDIIKNSRTILGAYGGDADDMTASDIDTMRFEMVKRGLPETMTDDEVRNIARMMGEFFKNNAPLTAAEAATIILDGVRKGEWRILVGDDAHRIDSACRNDPHAVYEGDFSLATLLPGS